MAVATIIEALQSCRKYLPEEIGETCGCSASSLKSKVVPAWCNPRTNKPSGLWSVVLMSEAV